MRRFLALTSLVMGLATLSSLGVDGPQPALINTAQIASALELARLSISAEQIRPLTEVQSTGANPRLEVVSVEPLGATNAKVRLRCWAHEECLPF